MHFIGEKKKPFKAHIMIKSNNMIIPFNELFSQTNEISKLEVPEELYAPFIKYLQTCYPDVVVAVSEKRVVDTGRLSKTKISKYASSNMRYVTAAEFYEILRMNFATEGFRCIEGIEAAYWEYRYVYYKRNDEPHVLEAYKVLSFEFAQADSLFTLKERGTLCKIVLPLAQIYDFVALAKENNVKFHIDNKGLFGKLVESEVMILFNACDAQCMNNIFLSLMEQSAWGSHLLYEQQLKYAPCIR